MRPWIMGRVVVMVDVLMNYCEVVDRNQEEQGSQGSWADKEARK
jgi:hypothetical protein